MRFAAIAQALEELEVLLPKLDGEERSQIAHVEARLRAALAGRCSEPQGCFGCPGQCHFERLPKMRR